jgi:Golgi phosphoprotein 3
MSTSSNRLTLAEELMLIALDDESGAPVSMPPMALELGLAAALIGELTLEGRLDTDSDKLFVTSQETVGDSLLDEMLADVLAESKQLPTDTWLRRVAEAGPVLRERISRRLVQRGVLKEVEKRLLWVFKTRVYPPTSGIEESEVKSRIMTLLNNDDIPSARDALLVGVLRATGMFDVLLSTPEHERLRSRIDQLADLEEIGRSLNHTVAVLQMALAAAYVGPM